MELARVIVQVRGAVQGVGFRPFVYRLATGMGLRGTVRNTSLGAEIDLEGDRARIDRFMERLGAELPPLASVSGLSAESAEPEGRESFTIAESGGSGALAAHVLPDVATCPDCLSEVMDPGDRRYRYPFTNCTNCGPRYTIVRSLPYDRPNTTMEGFRMCPECRREYGDPMDRRFHAQPNACPACGPVLALLDPAGETLARGNDAMERTAAALLSGGTAAVKGLGGFHLVCLACSEEAVGSLRRAKGRGDKPFAVMFPSRESVERHCLVSREEGELLASPQAPIVLLRRRSSEEGERLARAVAPDNPMVGAMLPYTPLHHILLGDLGAPVVATSGNLSEEPICTSAGEALERLRGMAQLFLTHDRPIARHVDDSVARVTEVGPTLLRRARGYAPLPVPAPEDTGRLLAVGGHLKSTVSFSIGRDIFTSQHVGDLGTPRSLAALDRVIEDVTGLWGAGPELVALDMHPDYSSRQRALATGLPRREVQHHVAHVASCMLDAGAEPPLLGVSWDGTGYGPDGTVWGGELISIAEGRTIRAGHLRTFPLPGGERAAREPRRSALGLLSEAGMEPPPLLSEAFTEGEMETLRRMLGSGVGCVRTSSMGRLFDAVASLCGLRQVITFEGEAAMLLEHAAGTCGGVDDPPYGAALTGGEGGALVMDWEPLLRGVMRDLASGLEVGRVSARFHRTLARWVLEAALALDLDRVALTGGCFQNARLLSETVRLLRGAGLQPLLHRRIPPNDGGIAPGQLYAAAFLEPLSMPGGR